MEIDRARIVDENFQKHVLAGHFPSPHSQTTALEANLSKQAFLDLFYIQCLSRHLDLMARKLKEEQIGFYTIGSSGHEGNCAIAKAFQFDDMAFLHYRSNAFMLERAKANAKIDMVYDILLSLMAKSTDPISGGRHKVFGSLPLFIPPQTSTIASHLPKALGTAMSISLAARIKIETPLSPHSVVLCSFGDASLNHSTAQGALNAASWVSQTIPLPLVWICEDNGIGISVPTPHNWIKQNVESRHNLTYIACDGRNIADVYQAAKRAQSLAQKRQSVFLHMQTVRLLGHAGSDIEFDYYSQAQIEQNEFDDPLLHGARQILNDGWLNAKELITLYETARNEVGMKAKQAAKAPVLSSAEEIMAPLIPPKRNVTLPDAIQRPDKKIRTMAQALNAVLDEVLSDYPNAVIFGEDVAKKGGVYHITHTLQAKYGVARVFDTLLDEQTILGTAIGLAHNGFLPIPEIQFLAYLSNAADQIRGEAASLSFFSKGQFTNPMVIRVPGFGYQKGFGGHFHNDNAFAFLRETPGVVLACPSNARDAVRLFRALIKLAHIDQRICIFLEPIALYMFKEEITYPEVNDTIELGEMGFEGDKNSNTLIISYGNGMHLARLAAVTLEKEHAIKVQLMDLRWLAPINQKGIIDAVKDKENVLIVDESRKTGGVSEEIFSHLMDAKIVIPRLQRLTGKDTFIPLGNATQFVLPQESDIVNIIRDMHKG